MTLSHPQAHAAADEHPELMTVKETAQYLRIPLPTVYYLVQRGQLPAIQIGGRWRIKRSLLDRNVLRNEEDSGQPRVLVVDDDPALQALFKQFLRKANLARFVVGSGSEALTMVQRHHFDLVFLDLQLPDIPGDEVYLQLKHHNPDLPVVIVTGYPDSEILSRILSTGPAMVIKKPLEFEQLNQAVRLLGHKGASGSPKSSCDPDSVSGAAGPMVARDRRPQDRRVRRNRTAGGGLSEVPIAPVLGGDGGEHEAGCGTAI